MKPIIEKAQPRGAFQSRLVAGGAVAMTISLALTGLDRP